MEHDCKQETPIALLRASECSMQKEIDRMREHIDGSSERHKVLISAINEIDRKVTGVKLWVLSGLASSLFAVLLATLFK